MRRLILEISGNDLTRFRERSPLSQKLKSLEILHFLRHDPEEFAAIGRIEFQDKNFGVKDLLDSRFKEIQVLEKEKNGSAYIVFIRGRPKMSHTLELIKNGGYLFSPMEIREGKLRLTFLGDAKQVKDLLGRVKKLRANYRIISVSDAKFSPNSPLTRLTEKQRRVLISAFKSGYFDVPKKINSVQLSKELGLGSSTVIEHLRKGERRLLAGILSQ
jgi:predicted DNA binding protein